MEESTPNTQGNLLITGAFILGAVLVLSIVVLLAVLVLHPSSAPVQTVTNNIGAGLPSAAPVAAPPATRGAQPASPPHYSAALPAEPLSPAPPPAARPRSVAPAQTESFDLGRTLVRQNPAPRQSSGPLPNRLNSAQRGQPSQRAASSAGVPLAGTSAAAPAPEIKLSLDKLTDLPEWQGIAARPGFKFLQAAFSATNTGSRTVTFQAEGAQAEDRDNLGYVANPELSGTWPPQELAPGQQASWVSLFLVPQDAPLERLSFTLADGRKVSTPIPR